MSIIKRDSAIDQNLLKRKMIVQRINQILTVIYFIAFALFIGLFFVDHVSNWLDITVDVILISTVFIFGMMNFVINSSMKIAIEDAKLSRLIEDNKLLKEALDILHNDKGSGKYLKSDNQRDIVEQAIAIVSHLENQG